MIRYLLRLGAEMISDAELESVSCLTPAAMAFPRPSTGFFRGYSDDFQYGDDLDDIFRSTKRELSPSKLQIWEVRDREERARKQWALSRHMAKTALPPTFDDRKELGKLYTAGMRTGLVKVNLSSSCRGMTTPI